MVKVQHNDVWKKHVLKRNAYAPVSVRLEELLRKPLLSLAPQPARFLKSFDRFEYLAALVEFDASRGSVHPWGPPGSYVWRRKGDASIALELQAEVRKEGDNWPPISQGLFTGSSTEFLKLLGEFEDFVAALRQERHTW